MVAVFLKTQVHREITLTFQLITSNPHIYVDLRYIEAQDSCIEQRNVESNDGLRDSK